MLETLPNVTLPHTMVYVIVPASEVKHVLKQFPFGEGDKVHRVVPISSAFSKSAQINFYIADWHIRNSQYVFLLAIRTSLQNTPYKDSFRMWTGPAPRSQPKRQRR